MKAHVHIDGRFVLRGEYDLPEEVVKVLESEKWDGDYIVSLLGDALPLSEIVIWEAGLEEIKTSDTGS